MRIKKAEKNIGSGTKIFRFKLCFFFRYLLIVNCSLLYHGQPWFPPLWKKKVVVRTLLSYHEDWVREFQ